VNELVPGVTRFSGDGGLMATRVETPRGSAVIYDYGAHVAEYYDANGKPVLWLSKYSDFQPGLPIRGGIPICFPWFGPSADPKLPGHGFVRINEWQLVSTTAADDGAIKLTYQFPAIGPGQEFEWPTPLDVTHEVTVGATLRASLTVKNVGDSAGTFEAALHSYFTVGHVADVTIEGLEGIEFIDKVNPGSGVDDSALQLTDRTDRVYLSNPGVIVIDDPDLGRRVKVESHGANNAVVWNPWGELAATVADIKDGWPTMVCVEAASVMDGAIKLSPGQAHTLTTIVGV
jgi:glucose-6-phosphate 1-epimerase